MPFYKNHLQTDDPDNLELPMMGIAVADTTYAQPMHHHKKGQLLYCNKGVVEVITDQHYFLVSPARAIWLPSFMPHKVKARTRFSFQSLYFEPTYFSNLPTELIAIHVSALLREIIFKACHFKKKYGENSSEMRLARVAIDEIYSASSDIKLLLLPRDKRLKKIFEILQKLPGIHLSADNIAQQVHITPRTLSRLCQKDFGCSFDQWRQRIIMMESLVMLEENKSISYISDKLGYNSESAFIYRFKQWMGITPSAYRNQL